MGKGGGRSRRLTSQERMSDTKRLVCSCGPNAIKNGATCLKCGKRLPDAHITPRAAVLQ